MKGLNQIVKKNLRMKLIKKKDKKERKKIRRCFIIHISKLYKKVKFF